MRSKTGFLRRIVPALVGTIAVVGIATQAFAHVAALTIGVNQTNVRKVS